MTTLKNLMILSCIFFASNLFGQESSKKDACPCCTPEHRQFDFWLGDWETVADGSIAGTNKILLIQDSCVIQENWFSAKGDYTGTSYNFYNKNIRKWQQIWVDNQGGNLNLTGNKKDNQMILQSEMMTGSKGEKIINRITWTDNPDGSVRQNWEVSNDNGKSWMSIFDGLYKKRNP